MGELLQFGFILEIHRGRQSPRLSLPVRQTGEDLGECKYKFQYKKRKFTQQNPNNEKKDYPIQSKTKRTSQKTPKQQHKKRNSPLARTKRQTNAWFRFS